MLGFVVTWKQFAIAQILMLCVSKQGDYRFKSMATTSSHHLALLKSYSLRIITLLLISSPLFITDIARGESQPTQINQQIQNLHQGSQEQRQQAVKTLVNMGKPAVSALIEALKHPKPEVRANAAKALAQMGSDAAPALPALSEALQDEDKSVRVEAAQAFNNVGKQAMIPYLVANLRNENPSIRYSSVHALTRLGKYAQSAVPTLIQTLQDKETWVRLTAASALGGIGVNAIDSLPALVVNLEDKDISARHGAAYALGAIGLSFQEQGNQASTADLDKVIPQLEKALKIVSNQNLKYRQQAITSIREPLEALKKERNIRKKSNSSVIIPKNLPKAQTITSATSLLVLLREYAHTRNRMI